MSVTHGARSEAALAPIVGNMKRSLLARMGLRQRDLDGLARELLDNYCRSKAKVVAIDAWLEHNAMIRPDGTVPAVMSKLYFTALNASTRQLEALRNVLADMDAGDRSYAHALAALEREAA
jgi:hypothetical protein